MDVHLRDLRYFLAVAEELHFGRAAERLFISQPALSKQIRQLERSLGVELFDRGRRAVALTAAGDALLPRARKLVRAWDDARVAVSDAAARESATLTVGLVTSVGRDILPATSRRFAERRPAARLQLRQIGWHDPSAGLASGETDVAFVWLPLPDEESFGFEPLHSEPRWIALPADHRLAARDEVAFEELRDEPFLALPRSAGRLRDFWLGADKRDEHPARVAAEVASADATFEAVAGGRRGRAGGRRQRQALQAAGRRCAARVGPRSRHARDRLAGRRRARRRRRLRDRVSGGRESREPRQD